MATWTANLSSVPTLEYVYGNTNTKEDPDCPRIAGGGLNIEAYWDGSNNPWSWVARLADCPAADNFYLDFSIRIRNYDFPLGWYSGVSILYRSTAPAEKWNGVNTTGDSHTYLSFEGKKGWADVCIVQIVLTRNGNAGTQASQWVEFPHNVMTNMRLEVCGANHKLYISGQLAIDFTELSYNQISPTPVSKITLGTWAWKMFSGDFENVIGSIAVTTGGGVCGAGYPQTVEHDIDSALQKPKTASIDIDFAPTPGIFLYYVNKDPEEVSQYARYITSYHDLDSIKLKHLKYVDMVGDYGDNGITLKWDKTTVYNEWSSLGTKYQTTLGADQVLRWNNLGHARRAAFMVDWSGNSQIRHEDINVIYNIKTQ